MGAPAAPATAQRDSSAGGAADKSPKSGTNPPAPSASDTTPADRSVAHTGTRPVIATAIQASQERFKQMALRAKAGDAKTPGKKNAATQDGAPDSKTSEAEQEDNAEQTPQQDTIELPLGHEIELVPLRSEWNARTALPTDFAPRGTPPPPATGDQKAGPQPGKKAPPEETQQAARRADDEAREKARQTYADLTSLAKRKQEAFISDANQVARDLRQIFEHSTADIAREHEHQIAELDSASAEQCAEIENATQSAEMALQVAYSNALTTLQATANSAWGAINAADGKASTMIAGNVKAKEGGHTKRFKTAVDSAKADAKAATDALQSWSDTRGETYSTEKGGLLERAKNEKRQPQVEKIASKAIKGINTHKDDLLKSWTSTSDTTLCNVGCSYKGQLDSARKSTFDASRKSVGSALTRGKESLGEQLRSSLLNLRKLRQSSLSQVRAQQHSARLRLTTQTKGTLANARRGAQGAINSVRTAARSALPGYWRALNGVEQTFRQAGTGGAKAILRATQTAPAPTLRNLDTSGHLLRQRLSENKLRLEHDQRVQRTSLAETCEPILQSTDESMQEVALHLRQQADESLQAFNDRADELNASISEAAQSCLQKPEQLFAESLAKSGAQADASLNGVFDGKQAKKDDAPPPGHRRRKSPKPPGRRQG